MASKSSLEDFEKRLDEVLKKCDLQSKFFTGCDARNPSSVAHLIGPDDGNRGKGLRSDEVI